MSRPPAGTRVEVAMTKWGARPHWEFAGTVLGSDAHGTWLGFPAGTHNARPGYEFDAEVDCVTLVAEDAWALPTFHAPGIWCDLYVDVATPATWTATTGGAVGLTSVDLDLDVIRVTEAFDAPAHPFTASGQSRLGAGDAFIDDEDEFATHLLEYGYPADVTAAARRSADETLAAVRAGTGPYDGSHRHWLGLLADR